MKTHFSFTALLLTKGSKMLNTLTKTLQLSRDILEKCQKNAWQDVEKLQAERSQLMASLASMPAPSDAQSVENCRSISIEIQDLNAQILRLTQANKQQLFEGIRHSNKSKRMQNAYAKK